LSKAAEEETGGFALRFGKKDINKATIFIMVAVLAMVGCVMILERPKNLISQLYKGEFGKTELFVKNLPRPVGLDFDSNGRLFAQSAYDGNIYLINKDGAALDYTYMDDYYGYGFSIDGNSDFLLASQQHFARVDHSGKILDVVGGFKHLYDVVQGPGDLVFVSDSDTNTIYTIDLQQKVSVFKKLEDNISITVPNVTGLRFDKDYKNLYALNMYRGELYKIALTEQYEAGNTEVLASNLQYPSYLDVDDKGYVYITCVGDNTVVRIDPNCIKQTIDTKGKLSTPAGIIINQGEGILYVTSKDTNSIYKITITPKVQKK
jgi:sugar lactone lactonase YvrE